MNFQLPLQDAVLQFTVLATLALLVQLTVERVTLPGLIGLLLVGLLLVGLLLIGIAVGPGALAVLPREPMAELLGEVGPTYIMFLAGVEINLQVVKEHKREVAAFGLLTL